MEKCLGNVRRKVPLIHCITNYVTVNDVANILLACGGSPIMSDEPRDAEDIINICNGLYINIGTLCEKSIEAMFCAGAKAAEDGKLILLDPVGVGASAMRTETAAEILKTLKPDIIRGNASEIKALAVGSETTKGVDAAEADAVTEENIDTMVKFANQFSENTGAVIVITGKIDLVADREKCYIIRNGCPQMSKITGTGCMLSGLAAAFAAANPDNVTEATAAAVCVMGLAGEIGISVMSDSEGNAALRNHIIDAVYNMDSDTLSKGANYEVR